MLKTSDLFETDLAVACGESVKRRLSVSKPGSNEHFVLSRIVDYPWAEVPNYAVPWHLIQHDDMRWDHVAQIVRFIETLRQPTGSRIGQFITLMPFQVLIVLASFGPQQDGRRLVRECLLTMARKSGKTAVIAGISLALIGLDRSQGGLVGQQIQVGAADREQAGITHEMISRFSLLDKDLGIHRRLRIVPSKKTISHIKTLTELRCLSSDVHRSHGGNPAVVLMDELGNVPSAHASEFYAVLTTGFGAQEEPLAFMLSTQAPNDQHFFSQQVDLSKRINEGIIQNNEFAGFVYELPMADLDGNELEPFDESLWKLANPGLGVITSIDDMRSWAKKAQEVPSLENKFRNLRLNQRISATASFLSRRVWKRNSERFDVRDIEGRACYLGLDLATTTDLCALAAVFEPDDDESPFAVRLSYWIPGDELQKRVKRDHVPFDVWAKEGLIDISSSGVVDYGLIADKIREIAESHELRCLGFDRWKMKDIRTELAKDFDCSKDSGFLIEVGQGYRDASRSVELLEEAAIKGRIAHNDHPILNWNMANTVIQHDHTQGRRFAKDKSYGRIDGVVALAIALHARARHLASEPKQIDSVYEQADVIVM